MTASDDAGVKLFDREELERRQQGSPTKSVAEDVDVFKSSFINGIRDNSSYRLNDCHTLYILTVYGGEIAPLHNNPLDTEVYNASDT